MYGFGALKVQHCCFYADLSKMLTQLVYQANFARALLDLSPYLLKNTHLQPLHFNQ
jgi:hypothetical protein